jgi:tetratricopeptide (TPR) repeat protein
MQDAYGNLLRYRLIIALFIFYIICPFNSAQVYPDKKVDSLLNQGIISIIKQDYDTAEKLFGKLNSEFSELPLGKIYLAANKIAEAFDYGEPFDEKYITSNLENAKQQTEILLAKDKNNVWYIYVDALVEGYTAYFEALKRNWITAFSTGFNSVSHFEKCLELDSNFYESYIAIGTFAYWKSRETEFLSWIPFISDDRDFAVSQLITAIDSTSYNRYLAMNSLIWIYIDKQDYQSAITLAQKALTEFPGTRLFKRGLARAYEQVDRNEAIKIYSDILESYPPRENNTRVNEIVLKHKIAQQYAKTGRNEEALDLCNQILSINNLSAFAQDRLESRLQRVRELKSELTKQN